MRAGCELFKLCSSFYLREARSHVCATVPSYVHSSALVFSVLAMLVLGRQLSRWLQLFLHSRPPSPEGFCPGGHFRTVVSARRRSALRRRSPVRARVLSVYSLFRFSSNTCEYGCLFRDCMRRLLLARVAPTVAAVRAVSCTNCAAVFICVKPGHTSAQRCLRTFAARHMCFQY